MDKNSLAHTKWRCKYHIVFVPKYRRQVIYGKIKKDIGIILRKLCERKGVGILKLMHARSYPYVSEHTAQDKCFVFYGLLKREKFISYI